MKERSLGCVRASGTQQCLQFVAKIICRCRGPSLEGRAATPAIPVVLGQHSLG